MSANITSNLNKNGSMLKSVLLLGHPEKTSVYFQEWKIGAYYRLI